ncbi:ABC transporter ATP-binding protein [Candidatus Xianfuyuplasma coldseepsis]|uniref:ABC transporter ATP-binding protein n=1 Tax=Candidatus Xianfuyuplasma coldseepsis TaxID=2782163 RepID=A0A7L7KS60_9MOLU|nr:ABC transporter ATP-binding protein [Xianfuyuplasma coldseepsis]QMS85660.1 ABC transporter ATP-binding protein [Xianfuyuplasma coldseepsis]
MIKLEALTKYYNKNARGILDVSLDIKEGEIFGFIGPNGAGKSTTVRTLLNLIFPTSGSATINNLDIIKDTVEIRQLVGYIPSEVHFYGDMIVKDFLDYAVGFHGEIDREYLQYLIDKLELDTSRRMDALSFGNKKKVAIIQALAARPKILILDEPTSGLDPLMQNTFFGLVEEERKRGVTVFFSSHILSEVQRICDRVGIIKEGKVIKVETVEDIMETRAKKVRLKTTSTLPSNKYITNIKQINGTVTFVFTGKVPELLELIKSLDISDITITEPTLEEIFMHYYEKEDTDEATH